MQFDFGSNWIAFSKSALTPDKIDRARREFGQLLRGIPIRDKSFLDIGFGQGLSILLAKEAGAKVFGLDINPKCKEALEITAKVMARDADFPVEIGSILDDPTIGRLQSLSPGQNGFDIVHAWGVLHHTGNMDKAVRNAASLVADSGYLVIALYNRHYTSRLWLAIKRLYVKSPGPVRFLLTAALLPVIAFAKFLVTRKNPLTQNRGMDFYYNVIDWIGGYPYEYASRNEVTGLVAPLGFSLVSVIQAQVPTGCNEFVFKKGNHGAST
jgi:SAM-dependent methyltransferase